MSPLWNVLSSQIPKHYKI